MSEECTHDCSNCSQNCSSRVEDFRKPLHPGASVKKVIGVVSGKGGVGKSLVTGLLASELQRRGFNCAVLDADITGPSIPKAFGITEHATGTDEYLYPAYTHTGLQIMSINLILENETEPVVWRGPVIAGAVTQFWTDVMWENVDYMFVDMPPGTGDVPLTVFQSLPVDGIVIVTTPQDLVGMIVAKAVNMAEKMDIPVLGMVKDDRHRTRALITPQGEELGIQSSPPLFTLIGRIQEEIHHYAISYHRQKHRKSTYRSKLDGVAGLGDVRKKALLKRFGTVRAVEEASLTDLESVLPQNVAKALYEKLHQA